jgi:hypothetical protein
LMQRTVENRAHSPNSWPELSRDCRAAVSFFACLRLARADTAENSTAIAWKRGGRMLERILPWVALDFDHHGWRAVALWLVAAQAVLVAIALGVDWLWFSGIPYGFFVAMLLFAGHVFLDAQTAGMPRPFLWAAVVTLAPPIGAIIYGSRRRSYQRPLPG